MTVYAQVSDGEVLAGTEETVIVLALGPCDFRDDIDWLKFMGDVFEDE